MAKRKAPVASARAAPGILWRQLFTLRAELPQTIQGQLRTQIIAAVGDGRIPGDQSMPSSRALALQLGVARNTVVSAYQQLADDGYLIARDRRGYYVNPLAFARRPNVPGVVAAASAAGPDWSARVRLRLSRQRNIRKESDWPQYDYPFIYGQFDPTLFPTADWRACCQQVLAGEGALDWAQDLFTRDDPLLVEQIRTKVLPLRGVWAEADEIIVTIGAQQALFLLADLLVDADTEVGVENPGYPDVRNILLLRTERLRALAVDAEGLRPDAALAGCDYVYVTPSHQSPTTVTMPVARRLQLLRRAEHDDFLIIEDDYENETSFSGLPNPALKSLDRSARVIYVGSLSKSFAPGLRLGYIVAPASLIQPLRALRRLMVRHPSALIQRSFAQFLAMGHYDLLNRRLMESHRHRAEVLAQALAEFAPEVRHAPVNGGSAFWVEGPAWLDSRRLAHDARVQRILIEPGDVHFVDDKPPLNCFRLGFASIAQSKIPEGIRRLGALIAQQRPAR